jgi:hypothetical protein
MKYQKGDLVKHGFDIIDVLLITGIEVKRHFAESNVDEYFYVVQNLTTKKPTLKITRYSQEYLDRMAQRIG